MTPEVQQELEKQFPPGSKESALITLLHDQEGFVIAKEVHCPNDVIIHSAYLDYVHAGFAISKETMGIFWRVDKRGNIMWIQGYWHVYDTL